MLVSLQVVNASWDLTNLLTKLFRLSRCSTVLLCFTLCCFSKMLVFLLFLMCISQSGDLDKTVFQLRLFWIHQPFDTPIVFVRKRLNTLVLSNTLKDMQQKTYIWYKIPSILSSLWKQLGDKSSQFLCIFKGPVLNRRLVMFRKA